MAEGHPAGAEHRLAINSHHCLPSSALPSLHASQPGRRGRLLWEAAMACPTQETQPQSTCPEPQWVGSPPQLWACGFPGCTCRRCQERGWTPTPDKGPVYIHYTVGNKISSQRQTKGHIHIYTHMCVFKCSVCSHLFLLILLTILGFHQEEGHLQMSSPDLEPPELKTKNIPYI